MFITPAIIYAFNIKPLTEDYVYEILYKWIHIIAAAGFFHVIGFINRGQHTTNAIHQGDEIFTYDFGEYQVNAVCDRPAANRNIFTLLLLYGEQVLHQLFPSIDAAILPQLKSVLIDTCKEFDVEIKKCTLLEGVVGQYKRLYMENPLIGSSNNGKINNENTQNIGK